MDVQPHNPLVSPLLTDLYQVTMAYSYWSLERHDEHAVFELFFRKAPFGGEYAVLAGVEELLRLVASFSFDAESVECVSVSS